MGNWKIENCQNHCQIHGLFCCRLFTDAAYLVILSRKVYNNYASEASYVT